MCAVAVYYCLEVSTIPKLSLKKRPDGRYVCRYLDEWFYGSTQAEALAKRDDLKKSLESGLRNEAMSTTVLAYATKWIGIYKASVAPSTYNAYAYYLNQLCLLIGEKLLKDVTTSDIQNLYRMQIGKSGSHIRKFCATCKALFEAALNDGLIHRNPCVKAKRPFGEQGTHRVLTQWEYELVESMVGKHEFACAAMLMLYGGLRRGEVLAFDIDRDVDFLAGTIHVRGAVAFTTNQPILKSTKTSSGLRAIPLFDPLRKALMGKHGLIIANSDKGIMSHSSFKRKWESYITALETQLNGCSERWYGRTKIHKEILANGGQLPEWQTVSLRSHDFRHSYCSMLYNAGVDLKTAMKWMGHADEKMILRVYAHLSVEKEQASAQAVGEMLNQRLRSQNGGQLQQTRL